MAGSIDSERLIECSIRDINSAEGCPTFKKSVGPCGVIKRSDDLTSSVDSKRLGGEGAGEVDGGKTVGYGMSCRKGSKQHAQGD